MSTTVTETTQSLDDSLVLQGPHVGAQDVDMQAFRKAFAITNRHKARDNLLGAFPIVSNYVVFYACICLCEYVQSRYSNKIWWATYIPIVILISSRMRSCEHLVHEASHNNLFTNPRWHDRLEFLFAFPVFRLLKVFRTLHLEHHKYLGDPVLDADVVRFVHYGFIVPGHPEKRMATSRFVWLVFGLPLTGWFHYEYIVTLFSEFWTSPESYPSKLIYWVTVLSVVHACDVWRGFALYHVVPWLGILPLTRWWAELGEHLGQDMTSNFGNSRTNDGFWQRWWIHPLNDGLHAAHHMNSQVPYYRLRQVHNELMKESKEFREKNTFSTGMFETLWQIYTKPTVVQKGGVKGVKASWNNGRQNWAK